MAGSIGSRPNGSCGSVESRRREFGVRGSNCRGPAQKRTGTNGSPTESVATARHTWRWISMCGLIQDDIAGGGMGHAGRGGLNA